MLDALFLAVKNFALHATVLNHLESLAQNVLLKLEGEARNAAVDSITALLQSYKVPVAAPEVPAAPVAQAPQA